MKNLMRNKKKEEEVSFQLSRRIKLALLGAYALLIVMAAVLLFNVHQQRAAQDELIGLSITSLRERIDQEARDLLESLSTVSENFLKVRTNEDDIFVIYDLFTSYVETDAAGALPESSWIQSINLYRAKDWKVFGTSGDQPLLEVSHPDLEGFVPVGDGILRRDDPAKNTLSLARYFETRSYWQTEDQRFLIVLTMDLSPLTRIVDRQRALAREQVRQQMGQAFVITAGLLLMGILMLALMRRAILISVKEHFKVLQDRQRMEIIAETDALTGLYSVRKYQELLSDSFQCWRTYGTPLSMIYYDIDKFKNVNDSYGHKAGDMALEILAIVSRASTEKLGRADAFRIGGDEFVVLVYDSLDHALAIANAIRDEIKSFTFNNFQPPFNISISMGVAEGDASMEVPHDLQVKADRCLYSVKEGGRDGISTIPVERRATKQDRRKRDSDSSNEDESDNGR